MQSNTENQFDDNMTIHEALIRLWRSQQKVTDLQQNLKETQQDCKSLETWLSGRVEPNRILLVAELQEQGYAVVTSGEEFDPDDQKIPPEPIYIEFKPCQICDETYRGSMAELDSLSGWFGLGIDE
jgi:hypothetical protein